MWTLGHEGPKSFFGASGKQFNVYLFVCCERGVFCSLKLLEIDIEMLKTNIFMTVSIETRLS